VGAHRIRIPELPAPKPKVVVDERRKLILADVPLRGYFAFDGGIAVRNKFTRNMGYVLDGLLRLADAAVYDLSGTARTAKTSTGWLLESSTSSTRQGIPIYCLYGFGTTSPTVTDNDLASPDLSNDTCYVDTVEMDTYTQLVIAGYYTPDTNKSYNEAGVRWLFDSYNAYATLLSRTVFSSTLTRNAYTEYFDGYVLTFPANYTRWFIRALHAAMIGHCYHNARRARQGQASDGTVFSIRSQSFAGSPDVMIGSDNTPPSPADYNLKSPIASLSSQLQSVEVDTTAQEVRVVRTGTYTPSTNVTLGEIGLFCNLNAYVAGSLTTKKTMLVRVALSTPVTLRAGTTYTLGIVIRLP
jgi:hypothetical protein